MDPPSYNYLNNLFCEIFSIFHLQKNYQPKRNNLKTLAWKLVVLISVLVLSIVLALNCQKSANDSGSQGEIGYLLVKISDDPFPIDMVEEAIVTINEIEIRKANENGDDGNPFITVSEEERIYNLITLRNGLTADLPEIEIPAGSYDLIRLYISDADIKLKTGEEFDLKVPSGAETGIKIFIKPELVVEGGLTSELLIDFDLSRSFIVQGNPNTPAGIKGFNFKPVIQAMNLSTTGRIVGMVTDTSAVAIENAEVWVEQDTVVATTFSELSGGFEFLGILAGTYDLFATKTDYDTVSVEDVVVVAGNRTIVNFELVPEE